MHKIIVVIFGGLFFLTAAIGGKFYWDNMPGVQPPVEKPTEEQTQETTQTQQPKPEDQNTTGMPLNLPDGFSISIFAKNLGNARVMTWDPAGNILLSIPDQGKVVALPDKNSDHVADEVVTVIDGLNKPHGLASRCLSGTCQLFVAETNQVAVYTYDSATMKATNKKTLFDLPSGGGHFTRTLLLLPMPSDAGLDFNKQKLLTSVGSSCNVCTEQDWRRAKILVSNADGSDLKEYAKGLRNSVFMTLHPVTGKIWATEMARDHLGDDIPPDEINIINEEANYGWPICYGKNIHDDNFDKNTYIRNPCMEPFETPSHIDLQAHSAPLGLAFIPEEGWPEEYWHNLLVAYHGSWNRSVPTGYKIMRFKLDAQGNYLGQEDFITGWLTANNQALGRPVDIIVQPGGTIYISDDKAGVIYYIKYQQ